VAKGRNNFQPLTHKMKPGPTKMQQHFAFLPQYIFMHQQILS
jgi:hypothetical protein